jgi:hypothetical protein
MWFAIFFEVAQKTQKVKALNKHNAPYPRSELSDTIIQG